MLLGAERGGAENGWGLTKDLQMASKWYKKSAQQGNTAGKINASRALQVLPPLFTTDVRWDL
jgi:TPR repeat protein